MWTKAINMKFGMDWHSFIIAFRKVQIQSKRVRFLLIIAVFGPNLGKKWSPIEQNMKENCK